MTTYAMVQAVKTCLDRGNMHYVYNPEQKVIQMEIQLSRKLSSLQCFIQFRESDYLVYAVPPMKADEESRTDILFYLTLANFRITNGNFIIDVGDGEIRYKTYVDCSDMNSVSDAVIARSLLTPIKMYELFGDGIVALSMGFSDPITEFKKASEKE